VQNALRTNTNSNITELAQACLHF